MPYKFGFHRECYQQSLLSLNKRDDLTHLDNLKDRQHNMLYILHIANVCGYAHSRTHNQTHNQKAIL